MSSDVITAAIYARKSVEEDSSNSVDNQVERGISYCKLRGWNYVVYKDEGISGKDTNREGFQQMMKDAEKGRFQYIITYKLDRISRNVADFANFTNKLDQLGIGYISLTENFDTSTPIGRAMMYIAAVFAQLERETIAERVRDNMLDNAKKRPVFGWPNSVWVRKRI
jgi:site-specific DNA recombinase